MVIRTAPESTDPVLALTSDEAQAFLDRLQHQDGVTLSKQATQDRIGDACTFLAMLEQNPVYLAHQANTAKMASGGAAEEGEEVTVVEESVDVDCCGPAPAGDELDRDLEGTCHVRRAGEKGLPARTAAGSTTRSSRKRGLATGSLGSCKSNKKTAKAASERQQQSGDGAKSWTKAKGKTKSPEGEGALTVTLDPDSHAVEGKGWIRCFMFVDQDTTGRHARGWYATKEGADPEDVRLMHKVEPDEYVDVQDDLMLMDQGITDGSVIEVYVSLQLEQDFADRDKQQYREDVGGYHDDGNVYRDKDESVSKTDSEEQEFADGDKQQYRKDVGGYHDDRNFHRNETTKSLSKGRSFQNKTKQNKTKQNKTKQNKTKTSLPKNRVL